MQQKGDSFQVHQVYSQSAKKQTKTNSLGHRNYKAWTVTKTHTPRYEQQHSLNTDRTNETDLTTKPDHKERVRERGI